jgi:tRNA U34 5-methylaminomethyl-2-thiouridine-forming methyltransferase MnmC
MSHGENKMNKAETNQQSANKNGVNTQTQLIDIAPPPAVGQEQTSQTRPTLIIGCGGTGQRILTNLKLILQTRYGDAWQQRIRLLAFDTTDETFQLQGSNGLIKLEAGAEFFDIGDVPVSSIIRNIDSQTAIKERLGSVLAKLPAGVMRSGSKQLRSLGLMALLWNHPTVNEQIRKALWQLADRNQEKEMLNQQQGINLFICGSLVGGTGSGAILDLAYLTRNAFTDLGTQAEFCHITGVGLLPQAFHGIKGPNMLPNTGAFLQELNHLMVKGTFQARYPDGRMINSREAPFDLFYVIDGVDQSGRTWADLYAVCGMAAQGIYLQMGTQLGRKGENAFDNLDEVLSGVTDDGQGTFLGSLGKGDLLFDAPAVANICARWLLLELLQETWLPAADADRVAQQTDPLLDEIRAERIRPFLLQDPETGSPFHIDLVQPSWMRRKAAGDVAAEAARYVAEYGQARVTEKMLPQIGQNGRNLADKKAQQWETWLKSILFVPTVSFNTLLDSLQQLQTQLNGQMKTGQKELKEQEQRLVRLEQATVQAETAVAKAASSFPIGRTPRIRTALNHYFRTAQELYEHQRQVQINHAQITVWHTLHQWVRTQIAEIKTVYERLNSLTISLEQETERKLKKLAHGGVATISLADEPFVQALYVQHHPTRPDLKNQIPDPLLLCQLQADALSQYLLQALLTHFKGITTLSIEEVIQARSAEMSPRARRQQLFQLATPSWNVDRARLPEGGAALVRLEVLGVYDASDSLFEGEPMLVSTHDPHRLTALVVAVGAPPVALQQYDQYMQAMAQVKGKRPLHVLPDFLVTVDNGRLNFALGSIFGLIFSQGTFFYYQPADPLQSAVKLANGLSNAINVFSEQETLVNEVGERVEGQIARLGLQEAIQILNEYCDNAPTGGTSLDEQLRELKRSVRDYTDGLRRIDAFSVGIHDGRWEKMT